MVFREPHNAPVQSLHLKGVTYFVQQALHSINLQLMAASLGAGEDNVNNILADEVFGPGGATGVAQTNSANHALERLFMQRIVNILDRVQHMLYLPNACNRTSLSHDC
jgi:hypothetical protein